MSRISRTGGSPATPQPEVKKVANKIENLFSTKVQPLAAPHAHTAKRVKADPKVASAWKARKVA